MGHRIVCDVLDNNEDGDHGDNEKDDDHGNDDEEDDDGDGECGDRGLVVINKQRAGQTETVCTPVMLHCYCKVDTAKWILHSGLWIVDTAKWIAGSIHYA